MEHEDNTQFDNYLQNSQRRMENMQIVDDAVCGVGAGDNATEDLLAGIGGGISGGVANIGGKFEEQDDEEEWKYIKEVQQSEKQLKDGGEQGEHEYGGSLVGNGFNAVGDLLYQQTKEENLLGNLNKDNIGFYAGGAGTSMDEEVEIIKNDGDFSTTSNTTSTAGEDDLLQVEMKTETGNVPAQADFFDVQQKQEQFDEEDPSSVATTTNGTSSLSENLQAVAQVEQQTVEQLEECQQAPDEKLEQKLFEYEGFDEKENFDPLAADNQAYNFNLNPNAQEFVPHFGSNGNSPTSPFAANDIMNIIDSMQVGEQAEPTPILATETMPTQLSGVPRHLLDDCDDFVAESPRKGRYANMDAISLPGQNEFEHEVAKRPHELEQEDDLPLEKLENCSEQLSANIENIGNVCNFISTTSNNVDNNEDCLDFQRQSPASFIDHGPETSVDLDAELNAQKQNETEDLMKQSMYIEQNISDEIEDVLNSVQPLPTEFESVDSSFVEEQFNDIEQHPEEIVNSIGDKESFNVEEKENISQSPSTEEFEMNLRNDAANYAASELVNESPAYDQQLPLDMKESFYMENTSSDMQQQEHLQQEQYEQSLLADTTKPLEDANVNLLDNLTVKSTTEEYLDDNEEQRSALTPSSLSSTEEKHLMEETKENSVYGTMDDDVNNAVNAETFQHVEQQFEHMNLANEFGTTTPMQQMEEDVAENAAPTTNNANENPFHAQEFDEPIKQEHLFEEESINQQEQLEQRYEQITDKNELEKSEMEEVKEVKEVEPIQISENAAAIAHEPFIAAEIEATNIVDNLETEIPEVATEALTEDINDILVEPAVAPELAPAEPVAELQIEPEVVAADIVPVQEPSANEDKSMEIESGPSAAEVAAITTTAITATGLGAAAVAIAATASPTIKKPETAAPKKSAAPTKSAAPRSAPLKSATSAKPKVGGLSAAAAKKPIEPVAAKKSATSSTTARSTTATAPSAAARPRTAPAAAKSTLLSEKKTTAATATASKASTTTTIRKTGTVATKTAMKTTTTTSTRPATAPSAKTSTLSARPTTASRPTPAPIRKPVAGTTTSTGSTTTTTTNGISGKPRAAASTTTTAPAKPTTLNVPSSKPKLSSPRANLTAQLRKPAPTGTAATAAKSPTKPHAPTTNGVASKSTLLSTNRMSKTNTGSGTTTASSTTAATKTFTARPAPKFNHTTSTTTTSSTTTRRSTVGGAMSGASATARTTTSALRKTSPTKTATTAAGGKVSPAKTAALKTKTKEANKSPEKPIQQPTTTDKQQLANGESNAQLLEEEVPHLNGGSAGGDYPKASHQNGFGIMEHNVDNEMEPQLEQQILQMQQQQQQAEIVLLDD